MELQLGLALSTHNHPMMKGFDLNQNGFEPKEMVGWRNDYGCLESNKRSFAEAFEAGGARNVKLCLVSWNGQPNEEDDGKDEKKRISNTNNKNEEEGENQVVGWPPINSCRKKLLHDYHQQGGRIVKDRMVERGNRASNAMFVKVKMEGVPIGRKINIRLYNSYQTLTNTLVSMFDKGHNCGKNNARYTVTYQDKEGDWLLAGDVPWQTFMESVCRLEIFRNVG